MRLDTTARRAAVAAVLLAATAAASGPAHADLTTTDLLVQVPALVGQLTLSTAAGSVSPTAARQADGTVLVTTDLPQVAISDSRSHKPGWTYSVALPGTLASTAPGSTVSVQHAGAAVLVPSLPRVGGVAAAAAGQRRKDGWLAFSGGAVAGLVAAAPNALSSSTAFVPQLKFSLPADTAPGEYRAVVTHSVV